MGFSHDLLQTILLLGFIQGSISSTMLWRTSQAYSPSHLMSLLLLLVSLACLNSYFAQADWFQQSTFLGVVHAVVPMVILMPVGPLLYFYIRGVKPSRWHFLMIIVDLIPNLTALLYIAGYWLKLFTHGPRPWADFIDNYNTYADIPRWLSITVYLVFAWKLMPRQNWMKALLLGFSIFQFIWLLFLVPYVWPAYSNHLLDRVGWYPVMTPLVLLIYWSGIKAWLFAREQPKYKTSFSVDTINETLEHLNRAMASQKLYLRPKLQVEDVANHTGVPVKTITAILNQYQGQRFNQWVNSYRVEAVKLRLEQGDQTRLTLNGIAKECGFNSATSFQRAFKQITGTIPSNYLAKEAPYPDLVDHGLE
jgi:AraC-like DNA-binding protein